VTKRPELPENAFVFLVRGNGKVEVRDGRFIARVGKPCVSEDHAVIVAGRRKYLNLVF
jgi:hypothetical protein